MSQTTGYGFALGKAVKGQKADLMNDQVDSYLAEGAVPFGAAVVQGTGDRQGAVAAADDDVFLGVAIHTHTVVNDGEADGYADKDAVSVVTYGRVWVEADGAVAKEADAYVLIDGAPGDVGVKFTATATDNLGPVGRFKTSGEDELVVLEVSAALRGATGPQGEPGTPG